MGRTVSARKSRAASRERLPAILLLSESTDLRTSPRAIWASWYGQ